MKRDCYAQVCKSGLVLLALGMTLSVGGVVEAGGFPYYGNWGRPGHSGGPAIDALDRAYRRHDQDYARDGWVQSGRADARLIERAAAASLNPFNDTKLHGRVLGPVSVAAFAVKPSLYRTRVFRQSVPLPATGATAFGVRQAERAVKGAKWVGRKIGKLF
jgi:hypothetical protein